MLCPVSVAEVAKPSVARITANGGGPPSGIDPIAVSDVNSGPPCQAPPPMAWYRSFQLAGVGNQTSMPMPADVDGASAGPGLPGPTMIFTRQRSALTVIDAPWS